MIGVRTRYRRRCPIILGDAAAIREMLTNLIFNAVDAMPRGGTITLRPAIEGARDAGSRCTTPAPA